MNPFPLKYPFLMCYRSRHSLKSNLQFSLSQLENVNISGINVNGAQLFHCKWQNLKIHELYQLDGHSWGIPSVCFSPDSTKLASGSLDQSVRLWDIKTGQQKFKFDGHLGSVYSVCFSPDGSTIASGSEDKSVRLWDVKTRQQKSKLDNLNGIVHSVCFSPDGNTLASGSSDKSIRLWDVKTRKKQSRLDGHNGIIESVCFSPDGSTLASGSEDKSVRLWDVKTGQQISKLDGHLCSVYSVCFSPDGTQLVSDSVDKSIRLWDLRPGQKFEPSDNYDLDILAQFTTNLQYNTFKNIEVEVHTIVLISQQLQFQAQGTLFFKSEFINHLGIDLQKLFEQRGSSILESQIEFQHILISN